MSTAASTGRAKAPVAELKLANDFPRKDNRVAISKTLAQQKSVASAYTEFNHARTAYSHHSRELDNVYCNLFCTYVDVLRRLSSSSTASQREAAASSRNILKRPTINESLQRYLPFVGVDDKNVKKWWTYSVSTSSGLQPRFSYEQLKIIRRLEGENDLDFKRRNHLDIMLHCYSFRHTTYKSKEEQLQRGGPPRQRHTKEDIEKSFHALVKQMDRLDKARNGEQGIWQLDDILDASRAIANGDMNVKDGVTTYSSKVCNVTVQNTFAKYDELGSMRNGAALDKVPGNFHFRRIEKVVNDVRPICADRPRVVSVEFKTTSEDDPQSWRNFKVEQYTYQLPKPLFYENSETVVKCSEPEKQPDSTPQPHPSSDTTYNLKMVKANFAIFAPKKGRGASRTTVDIKPKNISMERHILLRAAQLQLVELDQKFANKHYEATPVQCTARVARVADFNEYVWSTIKVRWQISVVGASTVEYVLKTKHSLIFGHMDRKLSMDSSENKSFKNKTKPKDQKNTQQMKPQKRENLPLTSNKASTSDNKSTSIVSVTGNRNPVKPSVPSSSSRSSNNGKTKLQSFLGPEESLKAANMFEEQQASSFSGHVDSLFLLGCAVGAADRVFNTTAA